MVDACLVLAGNLLKQVVHVYHAVLQFRFRRLADRCAQGDDVFVLLHHLTVLMDGLHLLRGFQTVVEQKGFLCGFYLPACQVQFALVVLVCIEPTDVP